MNSADSILRALLTAAVALAIAAYLVPKIRLHPLSMGITNNTWDSGIAYRSLRGDVVIYCDFMSHDSSPYWEGQNHWEDEHVCSHLPVYLHQGFPRRTFVVEVNGAMIQVRAPLVFGRLI